MNKAQLIAAITPRFGDDKRSAAHAVDVVLAAIQTAVSNGEKVSIPGFGSFEMTHKPARTARNPSTGAEVKVAESWVPKFRPGSDFKESVNAGGKTAAAA